MPGKGGLKGELCIEIHGLRFLLGARRRNCACATKNHDWRHAELWTGHRDGGRGRRHLSKTRSRRDLYVDHDQSLDPAGASRGLAADRYSNPDNISTSSRRRPRPCRDRGRRRQREVKPATNRRAQGQPDQGTQGSRRQEIRRSRIECGAARDDAPLVGTARSRPEIRKFRRSRIPSARRYAAVRTNRCGHHRRPVRDDDSVARRRRSARGHHEQLPVRESQSDVRHHARLCDQEHRRRDRLSGCNRGRGRLHRGQSGQEPARTLARSSSCRRRRSQI